ncbi:MAG: MATE family efflux transporter [Gemmatimonadaceae bacterium]
MRPSRSEYGALISLATPIVVVQVGLMTMGVVDSIMAGRFSAEALAAIAIGNFYFFTVAMFGLGVLLVLDPLIAQAVGARDETAIALAVQRGLLLALVLSFVLGLLLLPAESVLRALRQPEALAPLAARYVLICLPSFLPFNAFVVFRQLLQAQGFTRAIVVTIMLCNLANVALNWALIFGNLGFPRLGVTGAALATSISRTLLVVVLVALAWRQLKPYVWPARRQAFERAPLLRMLRLGVPIGAQHELEVAYFGGLILLMGLLGTISVAAHQAAINLASLTFMVPVGVASATAVFVGRAVGARDERAVRRYAVAGLVCGVGFMCVAAAAFLLFPVALAGLYSRDLEVVALAAGLIPIAGLFQVFDGTQVVSAGILRGIGDTRFPMLAAALGFWLVGLPLSLVLGFRAQLGAEGLWWGSLAALMTVAGLLLHRVRMRLRWSMERVVIDRPSASQNSG